MGVGGCDVGSGTGLGMVGGGFGCPRRGCRQRRGRVVVESSGSNFVTKREISAKFCEIFPLSFRFGKRERDVNLGMHDQ